MTKPKHRCPWVKLSNPLYVKYHDTEWGRPVKKDRVHFEFLILEGAQAGLSWETILKKRAAYRKAFLGFDPKRVAKLTKRDVARLMKDEGIVRNRLKIESAITNARAFLKVQQEFGTFNKYIWSFVNNKPVRSNFKRMTDYPARTPLSDAVSRDLKQRGFKFVGSTIIYAHLQATGIVNDHVVGCFCR